jgi:predicted lipoprotein with Yx(FWY)xxD motif
MRPLTPRTRARSATVAAATLCALPLVLAACSSTGKTTATAGTSTTTSAPATTTTTAQSATTTATSGTPAASTADVHVGTTSLGQVLVDKSGRTLYLLTKDTAATSTCTGGCAAAWPPLIVTGSPTTGAGVTGTVTTIKRADGTTQVVVNGHPLYTFAGDSKPGDTNGQNVEKIWFAVTPKGTPVAAHAS